MRPVKTTKAHIATHTDQLKGSKKAHMLTVSVTWFCWKCSAKTADESYHPAGKEIPSDSRATLFPQTSWEISKTVTPHSKMSVHVLFPSTFGFSGLAAAKLLRHSKPALRATSSRITAKRPGLLSSIFPSLVATFLFARRDWMWAYWFSTYKRWTIGVFCGGLRRVVHVPNFENFQSCVCFPRWLVQRWLVSLDQSTGSFAEKHRWT